MSQINVGGSTKDVNYKKMISTIDYFELKIPKGVDITKDIDNKLKTVKNMETTLKAFYYEKDYKNITSFFKNRLIKKTPSIKIKNTILTNKKISNTKKTIHTINLSENKKKSKFEKNRLISDSEKDKKKKFGVTFNLTNPNELFCYSTQTEPLSYREKINSNSHKLSNSEMFNEKNKNITNQNFKSNLKNSNGWKNYPISSSSLFTTNIDDFLYFERKDLSLLNTNLENKIKSMKAVHNLNHYSLDYDILSPRMDTTASNSHRPASKNFRTKFFQKEINREKVNNYSELSTNVFHTTSNSEHNLDYIKDKKENISGRSQDKEFYFNSEVTSRANTSHLKTKINLTHETKNRNPKKIIFENKCNSLCETAEEFKNEITLNLNKPTRDKNFLDPHNRKHILSEDDYHLIKKGKFDTLQHVIEKNQRLLDCQAIEKITPDLVFKAKELMNKRYQIFNKEKIETKIDKILKMEKIHSQRNTILKIVDNLYTDKLKLMWKIDNYKIVDKKNCQTNK